MSTQDPFQPPSTGWNPPAPTYGQPVPDPYAAPSPYGPPAQPYGAPAYGTPPPAYGAPTYGAPAYGAPAYGAPVPAYGAAPAYGYGYPAAGFGLGFAPSYASWLQRVGAYLLDSLAWVPYLLGLMVMTVTSESGYDAYGASADQPTAAGLVTFAVGAAVTLGLWVWNRWVRGGRTGQSWGKKALGITLQKDETGEPLGVWMAFVRDVAHYVDGLVLYLGYLWPLWDTRRQTFSDKLTKSVVVR
ncbi:RDD family protein [Cellulomonas sp.]|uniref:RDD family protein n=1 Tax=Cellulomonas sp. TaxID=40001 RepID=UPI003BAD8265